MSIDEETARLNAVYEQLSAAIVSVDCDKAEMADLLLIQSARLSIEAHGARKAAQSLFLFAKQIADAEDAADAQKVTAAALRRAGANLH